MSILRIAVDMMGGDLGYQATIPAVIVLAKHYQSIQFQLYGEPSIIPLLNSALSPTSSSSNITFISTTTSVNMDDLPSYALRHKRDSSMGRALLAVAKNEVDACISAGNTGALVAMSLHFLKTFSGITRPALCQAIPTAGKKTQTKHSYILDLGANVDCTPEQLQEFAYLGSALCSILDNNPEPTVRLLNIGDEYFKGSILIQKTAELLKLANGISYQGFVEANEIYQGVVDVVVCDGFSGNIALKATEGVAGMIAKRLTQVYRRSIYEKLVSLFSKPMLDRWLVDINSDRYNGAYLLGLEGIVVKSHGIADYVQFSYALERLINQLQKQTMSSMHSVFNRFSRRTT